MTSLIEMLALRGGGVISIVGGGGKTTLMFKIAAEMDAAGETVLTTTTTNILAPREGQSSQVIISPRVEEILEQVRLLLAAGQRHVTAAGACLPEQRKLKGFSGVDIGKLWESGLFRWILVEADGAGQKPLKVPAAHEPVIPPCSRWVIAVVGLDAVGQPLTEDWVFRSLLFAELTGLAPGERITESSVATALAHEAGIMKGAPRDALKYVFLNKADTEERRAAGREIMRLLQRQRGIRPDRVIIGSWREERPILRGYNLSHDRDVPVRYS